MTTRIVTGANGIKYITNEPLLNPPPQRQPLSYHKIAQILDHERMKWNKSPPTYEFDFAFARAIEAAHGIRETEE